MIPNLVKCKGAEESDCEGSKSDRLFGASTQAGRSDAGLGMREWRVCKPPHRKRQIPFATVCCQQCLTRYTACLDHGEPSGRADERSGKGYGRKESQCVLCWRCWRQYHGWRGLCRQLPPRLEDYLLTCEASPNSVHKVDRQTLQDGAEFQSLLFTNIPQLTPSELSPCCFLC